MIDRSHWADKSSAALNRERIADRLFDNFLDKCSKLNHSLFPISDVVVKAHIHLTNVCYKSFHRRVVNNGCKVRRRGATLDEQKKSRDRCQSTLYVISVTCPIHPSKAEEAEVKAGEAAAIRQEKAVAAAKRKQKRRREKKGK
jgi:hypothetical protein